MVAAKAPLTGVTQLGVRMKIKPFCPFSYGLKRNRKPSLILPKLFHTGFLKTQVKNRQSATYTQNFMGCNKSMIFYENLLIMHIDKVNLLNFIQNNELYKIYTI